MLGSHVAICDLTVLAVQAVGGDACKAVSFDEQTRGRDLK